MPEDQIPTREERLLVLRDKAAREGFEVPDDVLDYIAEKYAMPQTLKGALINVQAYATRRGLAVDMPLARLVLDGVRPGSAAAEAIAVAEAAAAEAAVAEAAAAETAAVAAAALPAESAPEPAAATAPLAAQAPEPVAQPAQLPLEPVATAPAAPQAPITQEPHAPVAPAAPAPAAPAASASDPLQAAMEALLEPLPESVPEEDTEFVAEAAALPPTEPITTTLFAPAPAPPAPVAESAATPMTPAPATSAAAPAVAPASAGPATVWFAPARSPKKQSMVTRAGTLLQRAGLSSAIEEGDLVAIKLHFGEEGNTGFVNPVFLREVVRLVREAGGKPFLTDSNTLYRGKRANAVEHLECALHNGFSYATVGAPLIIADGLDGHEAIDVPIEGFDHFDSVKIGAAAVQADAMIVVTHVKGHEATGFGGAMKNLGMGLGCRSAKQRMHSDLKPEVDVEKCTGCGRCVKWCPVNAIVLIDRVAVIDHDLCYGCGECVASCSFGAIGIQWKTEPQAIQEKIVEHCAGALAEKDGKVVYLSFITNVSPDCDCWHFTDASIVPDVGVVASNDLVAIDQASYDLVVGARGVPGTRAEGMGSGIDKFREITGIDGTLGIAYAEKHGLGTRSYELKTLE